MSPNPAYASSPPEQETVESYSLT